jgi:hypothetical protein
VSTRYGAELGRYCAQAVHEHNKVPITATTLTHVGSLQFDFKILPNFHPTTRKNAPQWGPRVAQVETLVWCATNFRLYKSALLLFCIQWI